MSQNLTQLPARLTTAQAGKIFGPVLAGILREPGLRPELAELAIRVHSDRMTREMLEVVYKYVYAFRGVEVHSVRVDRIHKLEDVADKITLHASVSKKLDQKAVSSMPTRGDDIVDLYSFKLDGRQRGGAQIGREYELRGLKSDPLAHIAFVRENHRIWSEQMCTTTSVWQDSKGKWCHLSIKAIVGHDYFFPEVTVAYSDSGYCDYYYGSSRHLYFGIRA